MIKNTVDGNEQRNMSAEIGRLYSALSRAARFSHAKDFSHHGVSFENCDKESCTEARAELDATINSKVYEDALPESITSEQYDWWYDRSLVLDGVRMGPPLLVSVAEQGK